MDTEVVLTPSVLISGIGMIAVAIGFIVLAKFAGGPWKYLGLGALAWALTVAVKFLIAIPLNPLVYQAIYIPSSLWAPGSLLFDLYVGALTGVTEVLLCWKLLRIKRWGNTTWENALSFGIGFGAFEALLLGVPNLIAAASALAAPQAFPEAALSNLQLLNDPLYAVAPIAERFGTILVHIFCCVLIFFSYARGQARWVWLAFAYKTLLDGIASFAQFWGVGTLPKIWTIEALILILGAVAGWAIVKVKKNYPAPVGAEPVAPAALSDVFNPGG